jgi:hypothetical protein
MNIPPTAVIRISLANFDPARITEVETMTRSIGVYLIPAIKKLPGLIAYYVGNSPSGSSVHVSIWESDEAANQMGKLKEMIVDARREGVAAGLEFNPIVNYPIAWDL